MYLISFKKYAVFRKFRNLECFQTFSNFSYMNYSTIPSLYYSFSYSIISISIHTDNILTKYCHRVTLSYYIFKCWNSQLFYCTLQVEFHVPDFKIALNKSLIVGWDISMRYSDIYVNDYNVLHPLLILIFTYFTSNYDTSCIYLCNL